MRYLIMLAVINFGCSSSFFSVAEDNCIKFYTILFSEYERCQFSPKFTPEEHCECVIEFNRNEDDINDCQTKLQQLNCDQIRDSLPDSCKAEKKNVCI